MQINSLFADSTWGYFHSTTKQYKETAWGHSHSNTKQYKERETACGHSSSNTKQHKERDCGHFHSNAKQYKERDCLTCVYTVETRWRRTRNRGRPPSTHFTSGPPAVWNHSTFTLSFSITQQHSTIKRRRMIFLKCLHVGPYCHLKPQHVHTDTSASHNNKEKKMIFFFKYLHVRPTCRLKPQHVHINTSASRNNNEKEKNRKC